MPVQLLLLAPLLVLLDLQASVDAHNKHTHKHGRSMSDNLITCGSLVTSYCGVGARCIQGSTSPICACLTGHSGNPLIKCTRNACVDNFECDSTQKCVNKLCVNPCDDFCGINAVCHVVNHIPVCTCPAGYTGDSFESCRTVEPEKACESSPCGRNTKCGFADDQVVCTCLPGYTTQDDPLYGCHHECESDSECNDQETCHAFKCVSPCFHCGVKAVCETADAHRAVCKCPRGHHGDPYKICSAECNAHKDCPSHKPACVHNACTDPCVNACASNANCSLLGLSVVCNCPEGMDGDPFELCIPFTEGELCEPNPCGVNAKCIVGYDRKGVHKQTRVTGSTILSVQMTLLAVLASITNA